MNIKLHRKYVKLIEFVPLTFKIIILTAVF